jgi:hypothetical protein
MSTTESGAVDGSDHRSIGTEIEYETHKGQWLVLRQAEDIAGRRC